MLAAKTTAGMPTVMASLVADAQSTENPNHGNGMAFDRDGSLVLAQMGNVSGHLARRDKSGTIKAIEPTGGPVLHTPDDVIVRSDGTIYFTDFAALLTTPVFQLPPMGQ